MASPFDVILTSFTGTDENPISEVGTWAAAAIDGSANRIKRISNECSSAQAGIGYGYWASSFGPDVQICLGQGTSAAAFGMYWRISGAGTATYNSYAMTYDGSNLIQVYIVTAGSASTIGGTIAVGSLALSDMLGVTHIGSTITPYKKISGVETALATRSDGTYNATGNIGLYVASGTTRVDQFGGGTIATVSTTLITPPVQSIPFVNNQRI